LPKAVRIFQRPYNLTLYPVRPLVQTRPSGRHDVRKIDSPPVHRHRTGHIVAPGVPGKPRLAPVDVEKRIGIDPLAVHLHKFPLLHGQPIRLREGSDASDSYQANAQN
jgi:hypothetical protein